VGEKSVHTKRYAVFLEVLIAARREAGLTQHDLAEKLGRPQSYVSKYERGERRLDVIEFIDVAQILGIDPAVVLKRLTRSRKKGET
jgi:transcriptional regulator with XRE-family HTH domain